MARGRRAAVAKRVIKTNALRRGVLGGSPMWRTVYGVLTVRKVWSRVSKQGEAPIAFRENIREGEAWTMVHVPEESKRGRGEGRKFLVGPKRTKPRASRWVPPALALAGRRILEVPDPDRINAILGADVVSATPPTRRERRKLERVARKTRKEARESEREQAKADAKAEKKADKAASKSSKKAKGEPVKDSASPAADAKAPRPARRELRQAKREAKDARKAEKRAKKAAKEARRSRRKERAARKAERKVRETEKELRKTSRKAERKARKAAHKLERKASRGWRKAKNLEVEDLTPGS